mmetsp:Transcript_21107/g.29582  ORF Transcript_21107/g.29582 Transcript_21107/m.29582 type:complete len:175 (+) Transcript_21107:29-553(+)
MSLSLISILWLLQTTYSATTASVISADVHGLSLRVPTKVLKSRMEPSQIRIRRNWNSLRVRGNWEDILMPEEKDMRRAHVGRKLRNEIGKECKLLADALCNLSEKKLKKIDISDSLRFEVELAQQLKLRPKRKTWARQVLHVKSIIRESSPKAIQHLTDELNRLEALPTWNDRE